MVLGDLFPDTVSLDVVPLPRYTRTKEYTMLATNAYHCLVVLKENGKVYFDRPEDDDLRVIDKHFRYVFGHYLAETVPEPLPLVDWSKVENRLKAKVLCSRTNTDVRVAMRSGNVFLVKSTFTFGQRTVPEGVKHVYQTGQVPLMLFRMLEHEDGGGRRPLVRDRCFRAADQYNYKLCVLEPNRVFAVPAGTTYVLMTRFRTLFALDVVLADKIVEGCTDLPPMKKRMDRPKKRHPSYLDRPPATPNIHLMPPPPPPPKKKTKRDVDCQVNFPCPVCEPEEPPLLPEEPLPEPLDLSTTSVDIETILNSPTSDIIKNYIENFVKEIEE